MEVTKKEMDIMNRLIVKTKPRVNKLKMRLIIISILVSLLIAWITYDYWVGIHSNISHITSLIIGGQLFALYGAGLAATGASYNTSAITLMSITRYESNPDLFYQLTRTTIFTKAGFNFLTFGLLVQAVSMILNESIGL